MTQIDRPLTLEERLRSRLHEGLGDIITDEDLKDLVERGMEEILFRPRRVKVQDRYGGYSRDETEPPLVEAIVRELLEPQMREAVRVYVEEHADEVGEAIERIIGEGAAKAFLRGIEEMFRQPLYDMQNAMIQRIGQSQ